MIMINWKFRCSLRAAMSLSTPCDTVTQKANHAFGITHCANAAAKPALFASSRFVVGSSNARTPHVTQNVSASARRIISDARTWCHAGGRQPHPTRRTCMANTFCPAEHRPFMSSSVVPFFITTL